jgi:hypothetical protein
VERRSYTVKHPVAILGRPERLARRRHSRRAEEPSRPCAELGTVGNPSRYTLSARRRRHTSGVEQLGERAVHNLPVRRCGRACVEESALTETEENTSGGGADRVFIEGSGSSKY